MRYWMTSRKVDTSSPIDAAVEENTGAAVSAQPDAAKNESQASVDEDADPNESTINYWPRRSPSHLLVKEL